MVIRFEFCIAFGIPETCSVSAGAILAFVRVAFL